MAKLNIEYGKIKKDGSRTVMIRLVSGKTQKHIPVCVNLEKGDYKVYPDGRVRVTDDMKYFSIVDTLSDFQKKLNDILRSGIDITMTAEELFSRMMSKGANDIRLENFFKFTEDYIGKSSIKGKKNYMSMLNSLQKYNMGIRVLPFSSITFSFLQGYCLSLRDRPRAQSLYLGAIRHIYKQACLMYNDDDNIVLSPTLFERFKVPKQKNKGQRALPVDVIRKVFAYHSDLRRTEMARDCFLLSFCLMGTNSVDLYNATTYKNGKLIYERTKTRDRRADGARIEIEVHDIIKPLFDKYRSKDGKHVFSFSDTYSDPAQFV